jgi:hypothetical protein
MREEAGEAMRPGVAAGPDDGKTPRHTVSDVWAAREREELALLE